MGGGESKSRKGNVINGEKKDEDKIIAPKDFAVVRAIGHGSFGKVLQVQKRDDGKMYAMKVLKKDKLKNVVRAKVEEELQGKAGKENHPFIVKLRYVFHTTKKVYLVLDYCSGGDLQALVSTVETVSEPAVRLYAAEIALALLYLHEMGIVYRDLKLENVLLDDDGHACLTDFGLATQLFPGAMSSSICGTSHYVAPEMLAGGKYGTSVDWWSFGVLIYALLYGEFPFDSDNRSTLFSMIMEDEINFPAEPCVSKDAINLIIKLLQKDPATRLCGVAVLNHPFFAGLDWDKVRSKTMTPVLKPDPVNARYSLSAELREDFLATVHGPLPQQIKDAFSHPSVETATDGVEPDANTTPPSPLVLGITPPARSAPGSPAPGSPPLSPKRGSSTSSSPFPSSPTPRVAQDGSPFPVRAMMSPSAPVAVPTFERVSPTSPPEALRIVIPPTPAMPDIRSPTSASRSAASRLANDAAPPRAPSQGLGLTSTPSSPRAASAMPNSSPRSVLLAASRAAVGEAGGDAGAARPSDVGDDSDSEDAMVMAEVALRYVTPTPLQATPPRLRRRRRRRTSSPHHRRGSPGDAASRRLKGSDARPAVSPLSGPPQTALTASPGAVASLAPPPAPPAIVLSPTSASDFPSVPGGKSPCFTSPTPTPGAPGRPPALSPGHVSTAGKTPSGSSPGSSGTGTSPGTRPRGDSNPASPTGLSPRSQQRSRAMTYSGDRGAFEPRAAFPEPGETSSSEDDRSHVTPSASAPTTPTSPKRAPTYPELPLSSRPLTRELRASSSSSLKHPATSPPRARPDSSPTNSLFPVASPSAGAKFPAVVPVGAGSLYRTQSNPEAERHDGDADDSGSEGSSGFCTSEGEAVRARVLSSNLNLPVAAAMRLEDDSSDDSEIRSSSTLKRVLAVTSPPSTKSAIDAGGAPITGTPSSPGELRVLPRTRRGRGSSALAPPKGRGGRAGALARSDLPPPSSSRSHSSASEESSLFSLHSSDYAEHPQRT